MGQKQGLGQMGRTGQKEGLGQMGQMEGLGQMGQKEGLGQMEGLEQQCSLLYSIYNIVKILFKYTAI
jgi:hypothetical protein